jgi:hypothetical protein
VYFYVIDGVTLLNLFPKGRVTPRNADKFIFTKEWQ